MQRIQHLVLNLVLLAIGLVGGLATATQRVAAAYAGVVLCQTGDAASTTSGRTARLR